MYEITFNFAHEFFHFIQLNSDIVAKADSNKEQNALTILLQKTLKMSQDDVEEIFHDFMPREAEANTFAAMVTGVHYKRHPYETAHKVLKDKGILEIKGSNIIRIIAEGLKEAKKDGPRLEKSQFYFSH